MDERGTFTRGPRQLTEHVHLLGYSDFPYYLIAGKKSCAIYEGGISVLSKKVLGDFLTLSPNAPLEHLIVAHTHTDHVTGLITLKRESPGLSLTATADSAKVLAKEKVVAHFAAEDRMYSELLVQKGRCAKRLKNMAPSPVAVDRVVKDGDTLDLGGALCTFIEAPGHAPGNLCFHVAPDNVLFITDSAGYAQSATELYPMFFQAYQPYMASLDRLARLSFDALFLGHNVAISNRGEALTFLERARDSSRKMRDNMVKRALNGEARDTVAKDYARRLARFSFFSSFPMEVLAGFSDLLIRRSLEAAESQGA